MIELDARYQVVGGGKEASGACKTVNVSSSGMLLSTKDVLHPGSLIRLELSWPVVRQRAEKVILEVRAQVVRSERSPHMIAGIKVMRHEFRVGAKI